SPRPSMRPRRIACKIFRASLPKDPRLRTAEFGRAVPECLRAFELFLRCFNIFPGSFFTMFEVQRSKPISGKSCKWALFRTLRATGVLCFYFRFETEQIQEGRNRTNYRTALKSEHLVQNRFSCEFGSCAPAFLAGSTGICPA